MRREDAKPDEAAGRKRFDESSLTIMETDNEVKRKRSERNNFKTRQTQEAKKSVRWMPWLQEAKKDVESCEKLRGTANRY